MSLISSTPQQIFNSPLNNSKSKMLYSFPKAKRLDEKKELGCDRIYILPPCLSQRAAGIGYGSRQNINKTISNSPGPNSYQIKSDIDPQSHKGWTMGVGRDVSNKDNFLFFKKTDQFGIFTGISSNIPGPGQYSHTSTLSKIKFTMTSRNESKSPSKTLVPGPGAYNTPATINEKGKYSISKFKDSGATIFNPKTSERFSKKDFHRIDPVNYSITYLITIKQGPGEYNIKTGLDPIGLYYFSKFEDSKARTFGRAIRSPGPGSYRLPSEFGYYESGKTQQYD